MANRNLALLYIEVWTEFLTDGSVPKFGNEGKWKPSDDPPNALFPIMQVECSLRSDAEYGLAYARHIRRESWEQIAKRLGKPKTSVWAAHEQWVKHLARMIETRPLETVVEQQLARWRAGERDPLLDLAARLAERFEVRYA